MSRPWIRQLAGVVRLELNKTLLGRRAIPMYLFASLPVLLCVALVSAVVLLGRRVEVSAGDAANQFAVLYQFILRGLVYLGCVWVFMNLFRGEVLDRSLHYYFLAPIRRELLVVGKFLSGLIATSVLFGGSALVCLALLQGRLGAGRAAEYLLRGPGLSLWPAYLGVTVLACLGYGAVFLLVGLYLRNPVIPALLIFVWEGSNGILPPLLKKLSVIFYLQSLLPLRLSEGPFALVADPVPAWLAVPGLLVFAAALLGVATLRARTMEIAYDDD